MLLSTEILLLFAMAGISTVKGTTTFKLTTPSGSKNTSTTSGFRITPVSSFTSSSASASSSGYPGCGGNYSSSNGTIRHPPYGYKYFNYEDCIWIINTADPIITFISFDTEQGYDFLYVRDGKSSTSPLIGNFTGDILPYPVQASSNAIFLQFTSDGSVGHTGFELQWGYTTISENCSYNGTIYQGGDIIRIGCARFICNGRTGNLSFGGYDYYNCRRCKAYLDPHIVTYDSYDVYRSSRSYSYQGCGNYSMTQFGNTYKPQVAVYATFTPCGGSSYLTCVDFVTFKNDEHTFITLGYRDNMMIHQLNGEDFDISSTLPTPVQINSIVYPVLAWRTYRYYTKCVSLYGSSGILVKFCGSNSANQLFVWPDPNIQDHLQGLCGNITESREDCFISRDGNKECPWTRYPNEEFGLSWLATGNSSCGNDDARFKRQSTQNRCEANSTVEDHFQRVCTSTASGNTNTDPGEVETLINDCVYDLCNVSDPNEWIKEVQETVKVQVLNEVNKPNKCEDSDGWRGKCFGTQDDLSGYTKCDSLLTNDTDCEEGQTCCVDCSLLTDLCENKWPGSVARNNPCTRCDRFMGKIRPGSGCSCCKRCKRTRDCRVANGRCISDEDPVSNRDWCLGKNGTIEEDWCVGEGCHCCIWNRGRGRN